LVAVQQRQVGTKPALALVKLLCQRAVMNLLVDIGITKRVVRASSRASSGAQP
jgi:hypothetical protein